MNRFNQIIIKCQELRERHGFDYETACEKQIKKFSQEIIDKNLINTMPNIHFAKQLCMANYLTWEEPKKDQNITLAIAQFTGFFAGRWDADIQRLVIDMGLTKSEWDALQKENLPFTESERNILNAHFKNQS